MTTRQAAGNFRFVYDNHEEFWARQGTQPQNTSCFFCHESFDGTVAEGIAWAREHRAVSHPKAQDRTQKVRVKAARDARRRF